MRKYKPSFIPAIIWAIISTFLLTMPGKENAPKTWLSDLFDKISFDKWVHIGMFAILVATWCWALSKREINKKKKLFISVAIFWFTYGIGMEFVQRHFVAFRSFEVADIIADGIGCVIGLLFAWKKFISKQLKPIGD